MTENENTQDDLDLEQDIENPDVDTEDATTEDDESTDTTTTDEDDSSDDSGDDAEDSEGSKGVTLTPAQMRHFNKWVKSQQKDKPDVKKPQPHPASPQQSVEETVLLAQGMPEELLTELKAIAQVRGTSMIKAQNDPIFVAVKEKFEKTQKTKNASLPAARGAGSIRPKKDLNTPGLSREEHKKLVQG